MNLNHFIRFTATFSIGALMLCGCGGKEQQAQQEQVQELAVITVGEDNATLNTGYPCTLHGQNDVEIRPQIQGFLTKVYVQEGQRVSAGQILFSIDQVTLQAAVEAARGQVAQAEASVGVAQANVNTALTKANNDKILLDKNIISAPAYQVSADALNAARAQLAAARAALTSANANLVSAEKNLTYSTVKAPVSGIVGNIDFKEGALVSPSSLLTVISSNSEIEAYFSMNEKEILNLTDNGRRSLQTALDSLPAVTLVLPNGENYDHKGRIISVSGVLDTGTGSATVKAAFPNPTGMLRAGGTGQILIPDVVTNSIMVPQKATYEMQDMKFVYVMDKDGTVHSTPITIGELNDGQNYIVTSGLKPGDIIVAEGVGVSVKDGMKIKPKTGAAK